LNTLEKIKCPLSDSTILLTGAGEGTGLGHENHSE
jgi:hypothetical protein